MRSKVISFRVKQNLYQRISELASREHLSVSEYLQNLIVSLYADTREDIQQTTDNLSLVGKLLAQKVDVYQALNQAIVDSTIKLKSTVAGQQTLLKDDVIESQKRAQKQAKDTKKRALKT